MPTIEETADLELSTQEKTLFVTCGLLVATYVGFALNARRQLKKSLKEADARSKEIHDKIAEAIEHVEKRKSTEK